MTKKWKEQKEHKIPLLLPWFPNFDIIASKLLITKGIATNLKKIWIFSELNLTNTNKNI